jgi:hypothetical protein
MERTPYMQSLMTSTYPMVAIEAIQGGFDGSWERLIAKAIEKDYRRNHSEAVEIVDSCDVPGEKSNGCFLRAAYLITSSKIPSHEQTNG